MTYDLPVRARTQAGHGADAWRRETNQDRRPPALIIGDSAFQAKLLKWQLESQGYEVVTATRGVEGLERAFVRKGSRLDTAFFSDDCGK